MCIIYTLNIEHSTVKINMVCQNKNQSEYNYVVVLVKDCINKHQNKKKKIRKQTKKKSV